MLLLEDDRLFTRPTTPRYRWDRHLVGEYGVFPSTSTDLNRWLNTRSLDTNRYYEFLRSIGFMPRKKSRLFLKRRSTSGPRRQRGRLQISQPGIRHPE